MRDVSKVGFLELTNNHGHQELLTRYLRIAAHGDGQPMLFTTTEAMEKMEESVSNDTVETVVGETSRKFFQRIEGYCEQEIDILFINTVQGHIIDYLQYLRFDPDCKTILWPHNARAWFEQELVFSTGDGLATTLSTNSKNIFRPRILKKMDGILVPFEQSRQHLESTYNPPQSVHALPPSVYDPLVVGARDSEDTLSVSVDNDEENHPLQITIPGSIVGRREYDLVLDTFESELFPRFNDDIRLTLLGRPLGTYGDRIIERAANLSDYDYDIQYFTEWIDSNTYAEEIQESDLLLNPIAKDDAERAENWGLTWNSGILFDILMYPCPAILPERYTIPDELAGAALSYSDGSDLAQIITEMIESPDRRIELATTALENAEQCAIERQFQRFSQIVDTHLTD